MIRKTVRSIEMWKVGRKDEEGGSKGKEKEKNQGKEEEERGKNEKERKK